MPHFIIECSENVTHQLAPGFIMQAVYEVAEASGLFAKNDIKVRIRPYSTYKLAEGKENFLHVFGYIMEGRSQEQKAALSGSVIQKLNELLPELSILSMNIQEFNQATYCNKAMIDPRNMANDRHFGL